MNALRQTDVSMNRLRVRPAPRREELALLEVSDREMERLGRDLHDGLCQNLAGIAALSSTLGRQLATDNQRAASAALEITRLLGQAIAEARSLARGLNPSELEDIGLRAALKAFAEGVRLQFQVSCVLRAHRWSARLAADVEVHLYRIVQEAVHNAIRHGRASRIAITLGHIGGRGIILVRDNGRGIPSGAPPGQGMRTMSYRARAVGASWSARNLTRRGARVAVVFGASLAQAPEEVAP